MVDVSMLILGDSAKLWPSAWQRCISEDEGCPWTLKIPGQRRTQLILGGLCWGSRHKPCATTRAVSS